VKAGEGDEKEAKSRGTEVQGGRESSQS